MADKLYSEDLNRLYDKPGKRTVIEFLEQQNYIFVRELRFCDGDLEVITPSGETLSIEVQIKAVWTESGRWQTFNWKTADFENRKRKNAADFFFMVNKSQDTLLCT